MRVLAVKEIDPAAQREATRGMTGMARGQIRDAAILCLLILVGVGLFYAGVGGVLRPFGESGPGFPVALLPVFGMIVYLVARIPFNLAAARGSSDAYLEPLGLAITKMPEIGVKPRYAGGGMQTDVSGPTVMSGTRNGAPVEVSIEARESETRVGAETPRFTVKDDDERLTVDGDAPDGVRAAVQEMSTGPALEARRGRRRRRRRRREAQVPRQPAHPVAVDGRPLARRAPRRRRARRLTPRSAQ